MFLLLVSVLLLLVIVVPVTLVVSDTDKATATVGNVSCKAFQSQSIIVKITVLAAYTESAATGVAVCISLSHVCCRGIS